MKFELELEGYNTMYFKDEAIVKVLQRELGGVWKVTRIPSEPLPYDLGEQVSEFVQSVKDRMPK